MAKLRPKLLSLAPGTRVVSHQFTLGDWEPDETVQVEQARAYLWVVPAKVAGRWVVKLGGDEYHLRFEQTHQMLRSSAELDGRPTTAFAARLRGDMIRFTMIDRDGDSRTFSGRVNANAMHGESSTQGLRPAPWSANLLP